MLASAKYAWYIIVLQLILALLSDHRRWKAYVVALLLPVIVLHGGVVMLTRTGAIVSGDPIESHGVQLQQIARIAKAQSGQHTAVRQGRRSRRSSISIRWPTPTSRRMPTR